MAVKDRIRVAKGRFLIPGSIKKIVLRDTSCIVLEGEKIFQSWHGVKLEAGYCCEVFLKLFLGRIFFKVSFLFLLSGSRLVLICPHKYFPVLIFCFYLSLE